MGDPSRRIFGATLALLLGAASSAHAQPTWDPPSSHGFDEARSGGEYATGLFFAAEGEGIASVTGVGRVGIVLDRVFELRFTAGWSYGDLDPSLASDALDNDAGSAMNPLLAGFGIVGEDRWRMRFGLGVTFPAAPATPAAREAAFLAASMHGLGELWLHVPERVTLVPALEFQALPIDHFYLEGVLRPGVLFPYADSTVLPLVAEGNRAEVDLSIDVSAAAGYRHENVIAGARVRGVFNPTFVVERVQSSLELFVRGTGTIPDTSVELFAEARFVANLDPGLGFAFEEGGRWGAFLTLGASAGPRQIPTGRYGVADVTFEGAEQMDEQSIAACLGTRERSRFAIDIGLRGQPECGVPPFDGDHLMLELWHWPWSEWPLFDENVLERDIERVERWYRARGFYDARVTSTAVDPPEATAIDDRGHACVDDEDCTVRVHIALEEGEPVRIARVALRGIREPGAADDDEPQLTVPDGIREQLRAALAFRRGDRFDEALYETTKQRMLRVLANAGYARAEVSGEVKINRSRREAFVIFVIDAGEPSVIGRVCVIGYGELPPNPMLDVAGLEAGDRFSVRDLEDSQRALYALGVFSGVEVGPHEAGEEDHAHEDEEDEIEVDAEAQDRAAPPDRIETAHEGGGTTVAAENVQVSVGRESPVCRPGPTDVPEGLEAVDIDIRVTPGRIDRSGFGVGLQAGNAVTFGTATTLDTDQNAAQWDLHFSAALEHRNLFDNLIRARLEVRPRLIFQMPVFNFTPAQDPPFGIQTTASFQWPAFLEPRTNLVFQIRHDLGPMPFTNFFRSELDGQLGPERTFFDGRLYTGVFIHGNWFVPTDRQPVNPLHQLPETGSLWIEEQIRLDLRDDPRSPTAGAFFAVSSQQSAQPFSSWDMVRWTAEARGYVPVADTGIVIAGRFEMGGMHILGHAAELDPNNVYQLAQLGPPRLQLSGGGASSNRGFLPGLLGDTTQIYVDLPRSDEELRSRAPLRQRPVRIFGGTRLWEASLEIRVPITTTLGVVLFADAGDVARPPAGSEAQADWRFDHPQMAFGLGLRYRTIIGPLRLDIALRPDDLQVFAQDGRLPPTCTNSRAFGCNPRNFLDLGVVRLPGAYHLTIGESF